MGVRSHQKGQRLLMLVLVAFSLLPVLAIILEAIPLARAGDFVLPPRFAIYLFRVTGQTLLVCVTVTALSLLIGVPSGYFLARIPAHHALLFTLVLSIPLASPSLVSAIMVRSLFEKTSWLVTTFAMIGVRLPSAYGFFGLVFSLLLHTIPYTILILRTGFTLTPQTIPETAYSLGASNRAAFFSISIPYVMPHILTASLMILVYTLGDLGAPLILGGGYKMFASEIYINFISNWGDKRIPLIFAVWSIFIFSIILVGLVKLRQLAADRPSRYEPYPIIPRPSHGKWGYVMQSVLTLVLLIPFITAVSKDLIHAPSAGPTYVIHDFSSFKNTLILAMFSVPLMLFAGVLIAQTIKARRTTGFLTGMVLAPAVLPGVLLGFGLLKILYALPLVHTTTPALLAILVFAMVLRGLPYVLIVIQSALNASNLPQEDSAKSLGAGPVTVFLSVTLPQIRPVLGMAAVVGLFICVTELSATLTIYPPGWQTMSMYIAYYLEEGLVQRAMLMAFLLLSVVETTLAVTSILSRRRIMISGKNPLFGTDQSAFLSAFTAIQPETAQQPQTSPASKRLRHIKGVYMRIRSVLSNNTRYTASAHELAKLRAENEELRRRLALAEQKSLRMQINPHFFFNTLNTIVSLLNYNPQAAAATIGKLSSLFRYTLDAAEESSIFLPKEVEYIRTYLEIEQLRFGEALVYSIDISPELYNLTIPPMLLQPLIENAIKYGKDEKGVAYVHISARKENAVLYLIVADYGTFARDLDSLRHAPGTGIRNVMQRLAYFDAGTLSFMRNKPHGVLAKLALNVDE